MMLLTKRDAEVNVTCLKTVVALFENGMIAIDQTDLKKEEVQAVIKKLTYSREDESLHQDLKWHQ